MPVEQFEQQIRYVSRYHTVVGLRDLLARLGDGCTEPMIALTFDDGYRDNYENALPILERYGMPATIFLTTGVVDSGEALWFEELAGRLKKTSREFLDLESGIPRRFWLRTEAERLNAYTRIVRMLRMLSDPERRFWLDEISQQLGGGKAGEPRGKMLDWGQVRDMTQRGIDFGGHTVTHPFLSKTTGEQLVWEVSECKRRIEEMLQREVEHFAYPNGREEDFAEENKQLLRKIGYRAAVTTIWGHNDESTDPMELRRSGPWEKDLALFASRLDWYRLSNQ
jgi:peptidoglycan/xylan/chitin deacetylase (PgdA/CDA1 family)